MQTSITRDKWFPKAPSPTAAARLFCLPYSGCGASMFRLWPEEYRGIEFCRLQPPGRENRFSEPICATYQEMAASLADAVVPHLDRPYAFFGHCGSALAAYEVTAELERRGMPRPTCVFVSSQVAPQDGPAGRFLSMSRLELGEELAKLIAASGGTPIPDLIDLYLDVLVADLDANKRYVVPAPWRLATPVTAIGWRDDTDVDHRHMTGWPQCGETSKELLDGSHHSFVAGPTALFDVFDAGLSARKAC